MFLSPTTTQIEEILTNSLRKKLKNYNRESSEMPFHYRLLGKDRMALYSFIQSLNTTFGVSIFEPLAKTLAEEFWDFLGGAGAYNLLLDCFERVGIALRPEIDAYFAGFKNS